MKYKILNDDQLQALEEDFIKFLVSNNVYTEEWEEINKNSPEKAVQLVEIFSDIVYEKALTKIKYLVHFASDKIKVFLFDGEKATMIGINALKSNLSKENWHQEILKAPHDFEIIKGAKSFNPENRSLEIFNLMENGAVECESSLFDKINSLT